MLTLSFSACVEIWEATLVFAGAENKSNMSGPKSSKLVPLNMKVSSNFAFSGRY